MAVYTPKRLGQTQATTSYATLYTVPAATSVIIKEIVVCNTTGSPVTFDCSFVASGGVAGVSNNVIAQHQIGAYSTVSYTFSEVMATGGFISLKAGAGAALTITISGVEFA
jgi:nicotinamide mononucleotide (NMN) deamidase PncC